MKTLVYYSVNTKLAYQINKRYYNHEHYVWVAPFYNEPFENPPTSNPKDIYKNLIEEVKRNDNHSSKILQNKTGLIKGAKYKHSANLISKSEREEIEEIVKNATLNMFAPCLYIIPEKEVSLIIERVPVTEKANVLSYEYLIKNLSVEKFDMIEL
jgi:hypothetical protein